jgi:hypothetical protein
MKNYIFLIILFSVLGSALYAQVKIGGAAEIPHPSAVLELDGGNNRGLLLPRMRKMDIDAIQNPAEGLAIYATDEQAVYLRKSLVWEKQAPLSLPYSGSIQLPTSAFDIFNMHDENNGHAIYGYAKAGIGLYGNTFNGYAVSGHALNIEGIAGHFTHNNGGAALVSNGKTGIGTSEPAALLHIDGNLDYPGNTIIIDDDNDPTIQFRKAGINKSFIRQQGNDLVLRPNDQNFTGKVILQAYNQGGWLFVDADGNASLGQDPATFSGTPSNVRMHIKSTSDDVLTLESPNGSGGPVLNFYERTGNVFNASSSISANITAMTFDHGLRRYDWRGSGVYGGNTAMSLRRTGENITYYTLGVMGNIGTGTLEPQAPLHIHDGLQFGTTVIIDSDGSPVVSLRTDGVEKGFIQQLDNDLKIGTVAANDPGRFIVRTNGLDRLWVDSVGYVTIGGRIGPTLNGPYRLAVRGKIAATDFNVVASGSWPDYVFDPSYKLRSLEETEAFIKEHKHLPNIPAAAVVEKEGFALGEMQKKMMEKIEELTLHLIEANKALKEFRSSSTQEIEQLKQQVQMLQAKK